MNSTTPDTVLAALGCHIGAENGITAERLARQIGISTRELRKCISELREQGVAVCGTPRFGYFVARTEEELEDSCAFLRRRALHSLALEARLRKITLPDLIGQMKLRT